MARSGQRHTARELASRLGCAYAYGVEFLELDLGGAARARGLRRPGERRRLPRQRRCWRAARCSARSSCASKRAATGSTARAASAASAGAARCSRRSSARAARSPSRPCTSTATARPPTAPTRCAYCVDAIDAYDRDAPVVIGGDLNSFSLGLAEFGRSRARRRGAARRSRSAGRTRSRTSRSSRSRRARASRGRAATHRASRRCGTRPKAARARRAEARLVPVSRHRGGAPRVIDAVGPATAGCSRTTKPSCSRWGADRRRTRLLQPVCYGVAFESAASASSGMRAMRMSLRSNMPNSHGQSRSMRLV